MVFSKRLRIGTRKSTLALTQAQQVRTALCTTAVGWNIELIPITTTGDRFLDVPIESLEAKGVFLKELQEALLRGDIDCAVHSMKDVPTEQPPGLAIAAILQREDPRDALIASGKLAGLPQGSTIGTGSGRRISQLRAFRSDLHFSAVRGNVDSRIKKWQDGLYDALVLAVAGLKRLGYTKFIAQILPMSIMLPAAGQGAIGIETRIDDYQVINLVSALNDPVTHCAVSAERAFLAAVGGGCRRPIGVYGKLVDTQLHLFGRIFDEQNNTMIEGKQSGRSEECEVIAFNLAQQLIATA